MVTSVVGKIFLEAYNEKHNKAYIRGEKRKVQDW